MGKIAKAIKKLKDLKSEVQLAQLEVDAEEAAKQEVQSEVTNQIKEEKKKEVRDELEAADTLDSVEDSGKGRKGKNIFSGSKVSVQGRKEGERKPSEKFEEDIETVEEQIKHLKEEIQG